MNQLLPRWDSDLSPSEVMRLNPQEKRQRTLTSLTRKIELIEKWASEGLLSDAISPLPLDRTKLRRWKDPDRRLWAWADPQVDAAGGSNKILLTRFIASVALLGRRNGKKKRSNTEEIAVRDAKIRSLELQNAELLERLLQKDRKLVVNKKKDKTTRVSGVSKSDLKLTFSNGDLFWLGEQRPGFPELRWSNGMLCEPVYAYFGYSIENQRVKTSSMKSEAYAIREWLVFQAHKKRNYDKATNLLFGQWRQSHKEALDAGEISHKQIERKIDCVIRWYQLLHEAMPVDERGHLRKPMVGMGAKFPITTKIVVDRYGNEREIWSGAKRISDIGGKRPIPNDVNVHRILTCLRSKTDEYVSQRNNKASKRLTFIESERNWLIGRCMAGAGLRAAEVANLTLLEVCKALKTESIYLTESLESSQIAKGQDVVDALAYDESEMARVLAALDVLECHHRTHIYVNITGKGDKTRSVPFAIDLIRDLLQVGIWSVRKDCLNEWRRLDISYCAPNTVFLSLKSKKALLPGSIGDIIKDAFENAKVEGSGHRLRAYYATKLAIVIWGRCFAAAGYRFTQTVENMALELLAEALGHAHVTTTVKFYLDMGILQHFGLPTEGKLKSVQAVWDAIVNSRDKLSTADFELVRKLIAVLGASEIQSDCRALVGMAIQDARLAVPDNGNEKTKKRTELRVISNSNVDAEKNE